jgi:polyhydroxyalkanoate synthase
MSPTTSRARPHLRSVPKPAQPEAPARAPSVAPASVERDSYAATAFADIVDRSMHAATARFTAGLSPIAFADAYLDWASHLAFLPGKRARLAEKVVKKAARFANYATRQAMGAEPAPCIDPLPQDHRFDHAGWQDPPFNLIYQSFLLMQQWWHNAMIDVRGVTHQHEKMVTFATRQILDVFSPSNFLFTNPEALEATRAESGLNLVRGGANFAEDMERAAGGKKPVGADAFEPGSNVAVTPGKVVFRNSLIELLQYSPTAKEVHPEPVLIVPAWIMKYYILDLSPHNSLVKYLVAQGFTVFMISWKNPGPEDRDVSFDDYRRLGVMAALDAVSAIVPGKKVHAAGYCLGGTLLGISAAAMARDNDDRLATISLFAAQLDFKEAGELTLFINESQLAFLEDTMWEQGFLDSRQMAGAFQLLRSNDLLWSRLVREYLLGRRAPMTDLAAWNADTTRMPYRMHTQYLRSLFLDNDLAEGRYVVGSNAVALSDISLPVFAVGTETDHIAPWRSVFKVHLLLDAPITFVLTTGGHNAGVVTEPGHPGRTYRVASRTHEGHYVEPDTWLGNAARKDGSWWPEWAQWLASQSGARAEPPPLGAAKAPYAAVADAPGTYVRLR